MANIKLLTDLRDRVRDLLDANSGVAAAHLTDAKITAALKPNVHKLTNLLIAAYGSAYPYAESTISTTADSAGPYALPSNFFKMRRVDVAFDGYRYPMRRFELSDAVLDDTSRTWNASVDARYRIAGLGSGSPGLDDIESEAIWFHPIPAAVYTVKIYYYPLWDEEDTNVMDVHGWSQLPVYRTVADLLGMQEEDPSYWLQMSDRIEADIREFRHHRDGGRERVKDRRGLRGRRIRGRF